MCSPHRVWPSGRTSTRSKSMTSFSGELYPGLDHVPIIPPSGRCHTALGIYSHKQPPICSPTPNKKSPEKSTSLLLSDSSSPPDFIKSMIIRRPESEDSLTGGGIHDDILPPLSPPNSTTTNRCKRRGDSKTNKYLPNNLPNRYDENRNLKSCSRALANDGEDVDDDDNDNDKHGTSVKKIIPGFFRKLRTSKRYKK